MKYVHMHPVISLNESGLFQCLEWVVKYVTHITKHITPEPLYALVMYWRSCLITAPVGAPDLFHYVPHSDIFSTKISYHP